MNGGCTDVVERSATSGGTARVHSSHEAEKRSSDPFSSTCVTQTNVTQGTNILTHAPGSCPDVKNQGGSKGLGVLAFFENVSIRTMAG